MSVSHIELEYQFWFGTLPRLLNIIDLCNEQHPQARNMLHFSSLSDLLRASKKLWSIVPLPIDEDLHLSSLETLENLHSKWADEDMTWLQSWPLFLRKHVGLSVAIMGYHNLLYIGSERPVICNDNLYLSIYIYIYTHTHTYGMYLNLDLLSKSHKLFFYKYVCSHWKTSYKCVDFLWFFQKNSKTKLRIKNIKHLHTTSWDPWWTPRTFKNWKMSFHYWIHIVIICKSWQLGWGGCWLKRDALNHCKTNVVEVSFKRCTWSSPKHLLSNKARDRRCWL